eukprot:2361324-Pyramimonas_sp.AAC.1
MQLAARENQLPADSCALPCVPKTVAVDLVSEDRLGGGEIDYLIRKLNFELGQNLGVGQITP